MKLLELPIFEQINALLSQERLNCHVESKIESYSCKMVAEDKKLLKELSNGCVDQMLPLSPPEDTKVYLGTSPNKLHYARCQSSSDEDQQINPLSSLSVKTHFFLVATLNKSFHPDYCFSSSPSTDFSRELNLNSVVNTVDSLLLTLGGTYYSSMFKPKLWEEIDREISLKDCEIYKYCPDLSCGPFGEPGVLWSFNYMFFNRKMKRIVYMSCIARSGYGDSANEANIDDCEDFDEMLSEDGCGPEDRETIEPEIIQI